MKSNEVLLDAFTRIHETVAATLDGAETESLTLRPGGHGNSVAWLVWHLSRVEDVQVAAAAGREPVWTSQGFAKRFDLPLNERDTGYGHSTGQVDAVKASPEALLAYYDAVHQQTVGFLTTLGDDDFDRIVDEGWDPPVTLGVRLVSTIADCLQHVGQAAYVLGLNSAPTTGE